MSLNPTQFGFSISKSPLPYNTYGDVHRMEMLHPAAPPADPVKDHYLAERTRTIKRGKNGQALKNPRVETVPGAHPNAVGFVDYQHTPQGPYIHYMETRESMKGNGLGRQLVDKFYEHHKAAEEVNWGRVMHPAAEKLMREKQQAVEKPRTRGKIW